MLLISSGASASTDKGPATWVGVLKLVLGALLLLFSSRQWRSRPSGDDQPQLRKWMRTIDRFSAGRATAMGAALAAVNPKNGLLTIGAGAAIAQTGIGGGEQAVALAVFIIFASLGVAAPVGIYFALGERSAKLLAGLKDWLGAHNAAIMAVLLLVLGAKLIGDGISILTS